MAIVLPNGNFENSSQTFLRRYLKERAKVLAVVALPTDTFIPFGTGIKTSVLCLEKYEKKDAARGAYKVFFSKIEKIGYEGNKYASVIYKKDISGRLELDKLGLPRVDEDVSGTITAYDQFLRTKSIKSDMSFAIPSSDLVDRFDVEYYRPQYKILHLALQKYKTDSLKNLVDIKRGRSQALQNPGACIRYVELSDVDASFGEIVSAENMYVHEAPSRACFELEKGDVVTAVAGNSIGSTAHASAIVSSEYQGCICSNGFRVLKPTAISVHYLYAFLKSDLFLSQVKRFRTGAAIPSIADEDFGNIIVPLLPEKRIRQIEKSMSEALDLRDASRRLMKGACDAYL